MTILNGGEVTSLLATLIHDQLTNNPLKMGYLSPFESLFTPFEGLSNPFEGLFRPFKVYQALFEGLFSPFEGSLNLSFSTDYPTKYSTEFLA